jgi:pimeloyl-ACP methyl ester carboxylesterase
MGLRPAALLLLHCRSNILRPHVRAFRSYHLERLVPIALTPVARESDFVPYDSCTKHAIDPPPNFLELTAVVGDADENDGGPSSAREEVIRLAYFDHHPQHSDDPDLAVLFCGGFRSDMRGIKAEFLDQCCADRNLPYCRFDYRGHGQSTRTRSTAITEPETTTSTTAESELDFWRRHATIGNWISDALRVMDEVLMWPNSSGDSARTRRRRRVVVVGSSMGAWIALHLALARPHHVAGLVLLAAAPDFTEDLFLRLSSEQRAELMEKGVVHVPSQYDPEQPYPVTRQLIEEARRRWLLLSRNCPSDAGLGNVTCPVRLLHGKLDDDVSHRKSLELARALSTNSVAAASTSCSDSTTRNNVHMTLVEGGDHRLSRPSDLNLLAETLDGLLATLRKGRT